jgi:hypothetical protein
MPFSVALRDRTAEEPGTRFYQSDLLPEMQGLLAALADVETRYEIARERIEQAPEAEDEKGRMLAELEAGWQRSREPLVQRLAQLQSRR